MLEGQVERRLPKLLHELPGVRFVTRSRELVMYGQAMSCCWRYGAAPGPSVNQRLRCASRRISACGDYLPTTIDFPHPVQNVTFTGFFVLQVWKTAQVLLVQKYQNIPDLCRKQLPDVLLWHPVGPE